MNDLALKNVKDIRNGLLEAVSYWGWQERICHDPDLQADFVSTTYIKHNEEFCYTLTSSEKNRRIGIHVTSPIQVPKIRVAETLIVSNYFNAQSATGAYYVSGAGDLCYKWTVSVFDGPVGVDAFRTLRDAGKKAFDETYNSFLTAAYTNKGAGEIIQNYQLFWSKGGQPTAKRP
ncbi:MAG: hypothetical protein ACR652_19610 [Methylocystis sp.]|uniref:hypothetical protein n=1 Tax=Methylocystis sp. TaxID=1911079 RepID=UPI003DA677F8